MTDDDPFAPPSGDLPPRPPGPPDWEHPAYQQSQWVSPYEERKHARFVPRSLVTACHFAAAGAWVFSGSIAMFRSMFSSIGGVIAFFLFGPVVAIGTVVGLGVAVAGLVTAIPLTAVWWGERHERPGDDLGETVALMHMVVAWGVAGYVLARLMW